MCHKKIGRGALIVFEGLDRSGKTTQTNKLHEYFQSVGHSSRIQRFPGVLSLFFASVF